MLYHEDLFAQQAAIDNGLSYLRSTQNPDGSWGGTATSLNTVLQTTTTTARTLQLLGVTDTSLTNALSFLTAQTPNTVDDLAQQLEVLAASGADVSSLVTSIKSDQQADGGWGIDLEKSFPSEAVDTLSAVRALKVANALDSIIKAAMLGYLLGNQNPDGGWGAARGQSSEVFYTALALLVLKDFQVTFNLSASIVTASNYLVSRQSTDGSFGSSTGTAFETAVALQAMLRFVVDPARRGSAVNYLVSTQAANGSWAEDAYSTALAIRALKDSQTVDQDIDNDGDGFTERQGDCDDTNPAIHPGATDLTVNGVDENCDGIDGPPVGDVDTDGDGFTVGQGDCDDTNPNIHPGAVDLPNNGIDEDCDGKDAVSTVQITSVSLFKVVDAQKIPTTLFGAYETIAILVSVNDSTKPLSLFVTDSMGQVLGVLAEGEEFQFDTQNRTPGNYTVTARVLDPNTGVILDEKKAVFSIQSVVTVANVAIGAIPRFTHVGATETVTVALSLTNRSNTTVNLTIEHEIKSPSGALLSSGATPFSLLPDVTFTSITLVTSSQNFTESGDYPILARVLNGTESLATVRGAISAAPAIRIDPSKTLTPQSVPPDGDKRIRIDIRLEGVEQKP